MDLQVLALAKNYTDKQIEKAEMGDIELDQSLSKSGFAADAKIVGDKFKNLHIPIIDNTLTQEGAAADAKAVGEALKNVNTSEQTQANWEQNDETAVDFIKNRTHYKTQINFTIIENTTVEFNRISEGDGRWTGTAEIKLEQQIPAPIAENNIITAIINGVEWTAPVEYNSDKDIMHAWIYYGMGGTLDIRFQQRNEKYPMLNYITIIHDGETPFDYNNFILSLYMSGASVIQIPLEYIPVDQSLNHPISRQKATEMVDEVRDDIPRSYYDLNDIPCYVKESESIFLSDVYFSDNNRLKIIEDNWRMSQYTTFEINGQLYPRKQYHTDQYGEMRYYYCGNGALIDNTGIAELEDTGEDFVIYANAEFKGCTAYYNGEIDGGYGFSINGVIPEEVKELDERCIPDTIARVSEIPESSNVYIGEQEPIDENIELWLDPTVETIQPIYPPATATIGQTIVVKAIDEKGVPTEWEAADLGGGGGTEKAATLLDVTLESPVERVDCPFAEEHQNLTNFLVLVYPVRDGTYTGTSHTINVFLYWADGTNDKATITANLNQTANTSAYACNIYYNPELDLYRHGNNVFCERRGVAGSKMNRINLAAAFTEKEFKAGTRIVIKGWRDNL